MANSGIPVTPGAGANVAVNQVGDIDYQVVKLDVGGDGASVPVVGDGTHGIPVDVTRVQGNVTVAPQAGQTFPVSAANPLPISAPSAIPVSAPNPIPVSAPSALPVTASGTVAANQGAPGANPWPVEITDGANGVAAIATVGGQKALNVNVVATPGAGAVQDKSAFTEGATMLDAIGGEYNDGASSPAAGQVAAVRITPNRAMHANLRRQDGTEIGTAAAPVRTDPVGTTPQPVSGTVNANLPAGSLAAAPAKTGDYDTGAGIDTVPMVGIALAAPGGAVQGGSAANPLRVDPTGATLQPVNVAQVGGVLWPSVGAGTPKVSISDGGGYSYAPTNPLPTAPGPAVWGAVWKIHVGYGAGQSAQAIHTPAAGKISYVQGLVITPSAAGQLKVYDDTSADANMLYYGTLGSSPVVITPAAPIPLSAVNHVLRYDSGAGAAGDIVAWGWDA